MAINPKDRRIPELLAPAGGRAQFFAALNAGADAVYLGLKAFNARARAENFTPDDLRELVPLAHEHGMSVLVTMNVLVKEAEIPDLTQTLSVLEELEVDAIIVQDLAVARIARRHFPGLRLHASTQMAVHNLAGVRQARDLGFRRVVLARELTATELRKIRAEVPREEVELEAFCHGSLCYSYSGLCFFSGAEDARSGNRGECAYTCRQPYKILSEPGEGFLFSMRDLDTAASLELLVGAGIDTLKIEGRKKDAQYVATTVAQYRRRLDEVFGTSTKRAACLTEADMSLSFRRLPTSFHLEGRYHENVIDLDSPTHAGIAVGTVSRVSGRRVSVQSACALERFDGLRLVPKGRVQHGARYDNRHLEFSLRDMSLRGKVVATAPAGADVEIELPAGEAAPAVGDELYKIRSADLKRRVEALTVPPPDARLRQVRMIDVEVLVRPAGDLLLLSATARKLGTTLAHVEATIPLVAAKGVSTLDADIKSTFAFFGDQGLQSKSLSCNLGADASLRMGATPPAPQWFVPRTALKDLKRRLGSAAGAAYSPFIAARLDIAANRAVSTARPAATAHPARKTYTVKTDRLETLRDIIAFANATPDFPLDELVFEPKRAFLPDLDPEGLATTLLEIQRDAGVPIRLALPTVIRAWDEPLLKRWLTVARTHGITRLELGNLGAFELARSWSLDLTDVATDFTLYALNSDATRLWHEMGASRVAVSIEDDATNLEAHLANLSPRERATLTAIIFKDTPLFIAEACSLTALHNGCPTAKVCGYRTLEIANPKGERFFVAHESCKSVVYGADAYSLTHAQAELAAMGVANFRIDFLTRAYDADGVARVLTAAHTGARLAGTHSANFTRTLL